MDRHRHRHHHHRHAGHQVSSFNLSGCMKLPQIKDTITKTPSGTTTTTSSSSCPPPKKNHHRSHYFATTDPSSPKVGCMGQIKRKNKSSSSISSSSSSSSSPSLSASSWDSRSRNKLFELKKAFMVRSIGSQASSTVRDDGGGGMPVVVSVADLDPPLPVVRRRPVSDINSVSLWERRCGGEALRGIQLEQPRLHLYAAALERGGRS
ncbi:hypothetical protein COCNU_03G007960 [Cocos nucifera]|uniref:Uncharacterized protein n=1 Tax=Cocos nucifera TaxID=13894 RepID=A0A8K0MYC3_COCNU|nr:hypothetical protein COCNU_03G007960 [Cocos nucifera]